jgi:hypothetical protein
MLSLFFVQQWKSISLDAIDKYLFCCSYDANMVDSGGEHQCCSFHKVEQTNLKSSAYYYTEMKALLVKRQ